MERCLRAHGSIENSLQWVLDVVFREDESRVRSRGGAAKLAALRKLALVLLELEQTSPGRSIARKRKIAAWTPNYAFEILRNTSHV